MRVLLSLLSAVLVFSLSSMGALAASTPAAVPKAATPAASATPAAKSSLPLPTDEIAIEAIDRGFRAPSEVKAGRYLVTLDNNASSTLEATFIRLPKDVHASDYQASLLAVDLPSWASEAIAVGGPAETDPGKRGQAVVDLTPGEYAITTNTANPPLTAALTVTEGTVPADTQASDAKAVIHDDSITLPKTIKAGPQIWQVMNLGKQDHQFVIAQVPAKTTVKQMQEALGRPRGAAAPEGGLHLGDIVAAGGVAGLSAGQTSWAVLDLPKGRYTVFDLYYDFENSGQVFALNGVLAVFDVPTPSPKAQATATAKAKATEAAKATATAGAKATATAAPSAGLQQGATATVTADGVNLRADPSINGAVVTALAAGTVVTITGSSVDADGFTWWPVTTADGISGWMAGEFLQPQ